MSGKHTPGPLALGFYLSTKAFRSVDEHIAVMRADGSLVATTGATGDQGEEQSLADARLFAAAPELAVFAQHFLDFYGLGTEEYVSKYGHGGTTKALGDQARAALEKAGVLP